MSEDAGYSMLEILLVLGLGVTLMAIASGFYPQAAAAIQGDANMRIVNWQLKLARETAINERRDVEIQFIPPNGLRLVRHDLPNGTTVLHTAYLENGTEFRTFVGFPDTPDSFGNTQATWFGGAAAVMFTADGMLTDATGNPANGTIFIGQAHKPMTARALTIFGPTATIRSYRWDGSAWRR